MKMGDIIANSFGRTLERIAGYRAFGWNTKHNHYKDFGWPEHLTFEDFLRMYERNSLAASAVDRTVDKTWETNPQLWEDEKPRQSQLEKDIQRHFDKAGIWRSLKTVDLRSLVGRYSAAILMFADGRPFSEEVGPMKNDISSLVGIIPAWEGQLTAGEVNKDQTSPDYGKPLYFNFNEAYVGGGNQVRQIRIHHSRVIVWSEDGTLNGDSALKPGFNDLIDAEKIKGAGGEGFWKTSRGAPIIEAAEGVKPSEVARAMGVEVKEMHNKINEALENFQSGFDKGLLLGGMTAKPLTISLPSPEPFFNISIQGFAASFKMPIRILVGNQTGERASSEDSKEWAKVNMGRRSSLVIPCIRSLIDRLVKFKVLKDQEWTIGWEDLTEATASEKMERASKMSEINSRTVPGDEPAFFPDEIREAAGFKPLLEVEAERNPHDPDGEDETEGVNPPQPKEDEDEPEESKGKRQDPGEL